MLKERLKGWEKGGRLLLADKSPALPSNSPSDNIPSVEWDTVIGWRRPSSRSGWYPRSIIGRFPRSSPADVHRRTWLSFWFWLPPRLFPRKDPRKERKRAINELAFRTAAASVGGALSPLNVPSLETALWSVVEQGAVRALGSALMGRNPNSKAKS